jgi:hypothetical protein
MRRLLALAALAAANHAHAAIPGGLTSTCSGALSQSWSSAISLDCVGDLSLTGTQADVRVESPTAITLRASGVLRLLNLTLEAPTITLETGVALDLQNTVLLAHDITAGVPTPPAGGTISVGGSGGIRPGGTISVGGAVSLRPGGNIGSPGVLNPPVIAVPEPAAWALLAAGVAVVAMRRRLDSTISGHNARDAH